MKKAITKYGNEGRRFARNRQSVFRLSTFDFPTLDLRGFTLLEVMVSLAIGALLIGSVMGLISEALRYRVSLKEKAFVQPILESAAQVVLADPLKAIQGVVKLTELEGAPAVGVSLTPVVLGSSAGKIQKDALCRVVLSYKSSELEFSMMAPVGNGS